MAATSWSSSSSCTSSFGSLDDDVVCVVKPDAAMAGRSVKLLCSYGGRILPRHTDGALRYVGGDNRVLSVDRSLHFYELQRKLREMCGWEASLRCQLPTEDLDALISVTSDDDLANLLEEYDAASRDRLQPLKIRAFLFPRTPPPRGSGRSSPSSTSTPSSASRPPNNNVLHPFHRQNSSSSASAADRVAPITCSPSWWAAAAPAPSAAARPTPRAHHHHQPQPHHHYDRRGPAGELRPPHRYLVHNGSHWQ